MADPRYPIGNFEQHNDYDATQRRQSIRTLEQLPSQMRTVVSGMNEKQLDTPYREGGWTVRQLVHHVPDSHMNAYSRFKLALTEFEPIIKPYDEVGWANLGDSRMPIGVSLNLLEAMHARWVVLLRGLDEEAWQRRYVHPQSGQWRLETALALYDWHSRHHLAHITELKKLKGW